MKAHPCTVVLLACGALLLATAPGCTSSGAEGVGDPCVPKAERNAAFRGFDEKEIVIEVGAESCATDVCLVNHFRGRVSCPYGQSADGAAPTGASICVTPGGANQVTGSASDPRRKAEVPAQCVDRSANRAVYCSCRCANALGNTDDGGVYCGCPDGFECSNVVSSIGSSNDTISGSYCIKSGTAYDVDTACNQGSCDPLTNTCD